VKNAALLVAGHEVWLKSLNVLERCASCTIPLICSSSSTELKASRT